jgi:hypothetical protein
MSHFECKGIEGVEQTPIKLNHEYCCMVNTGFKSEIKSELNSSQQPFVASFSGPLSSYVNSMLAQTLRIMGAG